MIRGIGLVEQHGDLLRGNVLFAGLDGVALAKLAARLEVVQLDDGEHIVRYGEQGDALYVISRGQFGVYASDQRRLRTCGRGELIGEMALLTGEPRSASVRAEGEAEVLRLELAQFDDLVRDDPSVPLALATTLSRRLWTLPEAAPTQAPPAPPRTLAAARRDSAAVRLISLRQAIGLIAAALILAVGWLSAPPSGFTVDGWHAGATLLAVVPVMVFGSLPDGAVALVLVATWVVGGVATPRVALGGFASGTWMLTIAVFVVGAVIASSGLLFRLALWSMQHARGGFKVEALALCVTGWISSAAVPNPSGRMLLAAPAVTEVAEACGYAPGSRPAAGLAMAALLGFGQTVAPFLTSSTTTLLTFTLLPDASRSGLDWMTWALRAAPTYGVLLVGMLAFIVWRYAPRSACARRTDALPVQRALLGPVSRQEWVSGVVMVLLLVCFATQPMHHVEPAWMAVAALGVLAALGLVTPDTLRAVNWNYALLFGTLASMVDIFSATSLDRSLASLIAGSLSGVSGHPVVFVVCLTLVCFAASFVLRFAAAAPLITVALAPVAATVGIDPWVVAIVALIGTSGFFLPYQSTIYQAVQQELNGRLFQHAQARPVAVMYGAFSLLAITASVPIWHVMGLL